MIEKKKIKIKFRAVATEYQVLPIDDPFCPGTFEYIVMFETQDSKNIFMLSFPKSVWDKFQLKKVYTIRVSEE